LKAKPFIGRLFIKETPAWTRIPSEKSLRVVNKEMDRKEL
jgi:hypothetical protein